jgi:putative peptidoglycan lipid II flippase
MLMGKELGIGMSTDIYFLSVMIISYLNQLVQSAWDAMQPYYMELKIKSRENSNHLYLVLLNSILLFSIIIIFCYFILIEYITFSIEQKEFLDVYIFVIFFQNILMFNKKILNLEHHYASYYLVDIFIYSINIIALLFFYEDNLQLLAYIMVTSTACANLWQFYLISKKLSISYTFYLYHPRIKTIIINSIKMKISAILHEVKEPLFAIIFLSMGEGIFSLYNYAFKFSAAIFQVTTTPSINRYLPKLNYLLLQNEYQNIKSLINKVLLETLIFFIISTFLFYLIMPFFLAYTFGSSLNVESIIILKSLFVYISIYYLIVLIEAPYTNNIGIFKLFNFNILVNSIFAFLMLLTYIIFKNFSLEYQVYLSILIFAQLSNLIFYFYKNLFYIRAKLIKSQYIA